MPTIADIGGSDAQSGRIVHSFLRNNHPLLPLVFAFAEFFVNREAGFFCIGDRKRLEMGGGAEAGDDLAHRPPARRALLKRLG